ncbi:MAG: hypothetical protein C5B50_14215 [Verrucomicrobia bacterium]|nr:MAG: hypothetical protein C5B50_14215 [Verrucomicrobiota bacterium]
MLSPMKQWLVLLLLLAPACLPAQQPVGSGAPNSVSARPTSDPLEDLIKENIDPDVLRLLDQFDEKKTQQLFSELGAAMNGTNIYRLSTLRDTARQVIPLLRGYEETAAVGEWLQTRLEYLEAADELEKQARATAPKTAHAQSLPPPTIKIQKDVWSRRLNKRPWPPEARKYLPKLKAAFAAEGVPPALAWIAEVESSFNPNVRSPAGAAGLFQLMPQTARDEHLSLWPRDERLQPEKSAHAAARRLRMLHAHYRDWPLALAAYNAGESRVDTLLKRHKARTFESIVPFLPVETQMYVPRIEATIWEREAQKLKDLKG